MLRKFEKKDYTKSSSYKLITLLNTLNKVLKLIVSKRIHYVVKTLRTFYKHNFATYHKKDSHNIKYTKEKNDIIF